MSDTISNICKKNGNDINQIDTKNLKFLKKAEQSIFCVSDCLKQLKEFISNNQILNQVE